jgi:hypothetical protein
MTLEEAQKILGIDQAMSYEQVLKVGPHFLHIWLVLMVLFVRGPFAGRGWNGCASMLCE